jgi:trehalose synthase-fused probable maltokinase
MTARGEPPRLTSASADEALGRDALAGLPPEALAGWLAEQRWFGAKGRATRAVVVRDATRLPWDGVAAALVRVDVELDDGARSRYVVPLALAPEGELPRGKGAPRPVATVEAGGRATALVDAAWLASFRRGLARAFAAQATVEGSGVRWRFEGVDGRAPDLDPAEESRVGGAEQSNTSILFGERAICKLFRRSEPGESPDVELTRALTRAGFPHTPPLLGTVRAEDADGTTVAAMLQRLVPRSRDAWAHALEASRPYFGAPRDAEPAHTFAADAHRLGEVTRAMHDALAGIADDPAFAPRPAAPADVEQWAEAARRRVRDGLALLRARGASLPGPRAAEAQALVAREGHFLDLVARIARSLGDDAGALVRHHGDYHLGQVLHDADGRFHVIDYEGEPARPLAERRAPSSAARDVAGMLRSFAYAGATLATEARGPDGRAVDAATSERRIGRWERDARNAFLAGYLGGEGERPPAYLPKSPGGTQRLIALFELEKAFYELAYELNNRPDWVWIPMRGVSKLFATVDAA